MDIQDGVRRRSRRAETGGPAPAAGADADAGVLALSLLRDFAGVEDGDELLRTVLMHAVVETVSDRGIISWIEGDQMVVGACYDPFGELVPAGSRWPLEGGEVSHMARVVGELTSRAAGDQTLPPALRDTYAGLRHLAAAPVTVGADSIAMLCVSRRRAEEYSEADRTRLDLVALAAAHPLDALRQRRELCQARSELAGHMQRSEALERIKTDILRLASHELRTPLTVLNGYLSLVDDGFFGDVPPPLRPVMDLLQRRTAEMNALVTDMLVAARVEEVSTVPTGAAIDLRETVCDALEAVRQRASPAHRLRIELPEEPVMGLVDGERMTLAVRNLVDNAVKYSPAGGDVVCTLRADDERAVISVRDQGLGIAPADQAKLFTRFGRILTPENSHIPGIGLGLYFTREVARRHGGDVVLAKSDAGGTVFELSVPLTG